MMYSINEFEERKYSVYRMNNTVLILNIPSMGVGIFLYRFYYLPALTTKITPSQ